MKITMFCLTYLVLSCTACGRFATNKDLDKVDRKVNDVSQRVKVLEQDYATLETNLNNANSSLYSLQSSMTDLSVVVDNLSEDQATQMGLIEELQLQTEQLESIQTNIAALQGQMDMVQLKLTEMALEDRVVAMIDPCPSPVFTGYSEVFMVTSHGQYVAYFETGSTRHLTILRQGVLYQTTDSKACKFKLNASNQIVLQ